MSRLRMISLVVCLDVLSLGKIRLIWSMFLSSDSPAVKPNRFKMSWTLSLKRRSKQADDKLQNKSKSMERLSSFKIKTNSLKRSSPTRN